MSKRRSVKRIIHRAMEEVRATKEIALATSWKEALVTFLAKVDIQIMNRNGYQESAATKRRLLKKHEVMIRFFERKFEAFLVEYQYDRSLPESAPENRNRIWVCWWQGLDHAPELVKKCIDSIVQNAGDHQVTVITEKNYRQFVDIPAWAEEKFRKGIISRTHYSDILRLCLLAQHGGMWLDATFFCTEPILDSYFRLPLWSIRRPDYLHVSVACGQFATYSLACSYENRWLFATIRDFVLNYWRTHDLMVDYLFLDYLFVLAQRKNSRILDAFRAIEPNNPQCDELCKVLNKPYDEGVWVHMCENTALFKLTWKQNFLRSADNQDTFYAKLQSNNL